MSFSKGWRERRDAAVERQQKNGNSHYREYSAEVNLRNVAEAHLATFQTRHQRLVDEHLMLDRELAALKERASEDNKIVSPSHPVVLKLRELPALIADAADTLKAAHAEYKRQMKESDERWAEMKARHEFEVDRERRADAAAEAARAAIMAEPDAPKPTNRNAK